MSATKLPPAIIIRFVAPAAQRYQTVGDWQTDADGTLRVTISRMSNDASFCVAVHELLEAYLSLRAGITADEVDKADSLPLRPPYEEHGDMPSSIYHQQHDFAWVVERLVAHEMGLDWALYEQELDEAYDAAPNRTAKGSVKHGD